MKAYHFVGDTLRDGRAIPADGEWLIHEGEIVPCKSGLHASDHPSDALRYALGNTLCLVELEGDIVEHEQDKVVGRRRMIVKRIDAEPLMREFARWCALQVIELWDAPEVVKQYLTTGDESLMDAAWDASWAATQDVAQSESQSAARAAAWPDARAGAQAAAWDAVRAAWDAAWDAAGDAAGHARAARDAWDAVWPAAGATQRDKFAQMVNSAFEVTK